MKLFPHQVQGSEWLSQRRSSLLCFSPRMGKTATCLEWHRKASVFKPHPLLVVCPAVALGVWRDEAQTWRPDLTVRVVQRGADFTWPGPAEMVVVSYDNLPAMHHAPPVKGTYLVVDECQKIRKGTSTVHDKVGGLIACILASDCSGAVVGATGTPVMHTYDDLWNLLTAFQLRQETWTRYDRFVRDLGGTVMMRGHRDGAGFRTVTYAADWKDAVPRACVGTVLKKVLLHRRREDVADTMARAFCSVSVLEVPLSADTKGLCDEALRAMRRRGITLHEAMDIVMLNRKMQFSEISRAMSALCAAKAPALLELVEEYEQAGDPLIVASAHRAPLDALVARGDVLGPDGEAKGWRAIHSGASPALRQRIVRELTAGRLRGVGISPQSGGVAIDLSAASQMVVVDRDWGPGANEQVVDRIMGPKQRNPCHVTYLMADHDLERRLQAVLLEKGEKVRKLMQGVRV